MRWEDSSSGSRAKRKRGRQLSADAGTERIAAGSSRQDAWYPAGRSPEGAAPKASAAKDHSRARQDAKRRGDMDVERLTDKKALGCRLLYTKRWLTTS